MLTLVSAPAGFGKTTLLSESFAGSAWVELDPSVVGKIGEEVERQTGEKVELSSEVDDEILGGIVLRVGNMVLDASIATRLEKLRKSVASAA